jgi:hypothetical protein
VVDFKVKVLPEISSLAGRMLRRRVPVSLCCVLQTYFLYVSYDDVWCTSWGQCYDYLKTFSRQQFGDFEMLLAEDKNYSYQWL